MRRLVLYSVCFGILAASSAQTQQKAKPLLVLNPDGHCDIVRKVLFTPSGKTVITVCRDKTIRVWNVEKGQAIRVYRLPSGPADEGAPYAAALSPDGKYLAVGGMPYGRGKYGIPIHVISIQQNRVAQLCKGHLGVITSLDFSKNKRWLLSGSGDGTARVFDARTGRSLLVLKGHKGSIRQVAFAPNNAAMATVASDNAVRFWGLTGTTRATYSINKAPIKQKKKKRKKKTKVNNIPRNTTNLTCIAWSPDGKLLAVGDDKGNISLLDSLGKVKKTLSGLNNKLTSVTFTPDGKEILFTGSGIGTAKSAAALVSVATGKVRTQCKLHTNTVIDGTVSSNGKLAASAGGDNHETYIWNTADGKVIQKLVGNGKTVFSVGWSPDSKSVAWGNSNSEGLPLEHSFHLSDLEKGSPPTAEFQRTIDKNGTWSMALTANRRLVILDGKKIVHTFQSPIPNERIYSYSWLKDGRAILGGAGDLYLIDPKSNRILRTFVGHASNILAVAPSPDGKLFASGGADQTVRIWNPDYEEPLLSLFFAGREWITWTPEGYYMASPTGERLLGWQKNNGAFRLAGFNSANRFRFSLRQPNIVKRVVAAGSMTKALILAGKKPNEATTISKVTPPDVDITAPTGSATIQDADGKVEIKATAKSGNKYPIRSLRLIVDGRPYQGKKGLRAINPPRVGPLTQTWSVELDPGIHTIAVKAETRVSKALSKSIEINCGGKPARPPHLYVLAIGVSAYPGQLKLRYAAIDAKSIAAALQKSSATTFDKIEVNVVTDAAATRTGIQDGFNWFKSKMKPRDVGVIFFSGHGGKDRSGNFFIMPVDGKAAALGATCVSGDFIKGTLSEVPGKVVAILDACHSGSVGESRSPVDDIISELTSEDYGVVVMSSSMGREVSFESPTTKHGFYTLALLEGLAGKADFNGDGQIFLNELDGYAAKRVNGLSKGRQTPVTAKPPHVKWFPLVKKK